MKNEYLGEVLEKKFEDVSQKIKILHLVIESRRKRMANLIWPIKVLENWDIERTLEKEYNRLLQEKQSLRETLAIC